MYASNRGDVNKGLRAEAYRVCDAHLKKGVRGAFTCLYRQEAYSLPATHEAVETA